MSLVAYVLVSFVTALQHLYNVHEAVHLQLTTDDLHAPRAETAVISVDVHVDPDQM